MNRAGLVSALPDRLAAHSTVGAAGLASIDSWPYELATAYEQLITEPDIPIIRPPALYELRLLITTMRNNDRFVEEVGQEFRNADRGVLDRSVPVPLKRDGGAGGRSTAAKRPRSDDDTTTRGTADALVASAESQVGYREKPNNNNKYSSEVGHPNNEAWCATFVVAMLARQGINIGSANTASSRTMLAEAQQNGWGIRMRDLRPGDIVHRQRGSGWQGHVGIVVAVDGDYITTVEGNAGAGSTSVVRKVSRRSKWDLGAWRPPYRKPNDKAA
jgi:hypothetical protein